MQHAKAESIDEYRQRRKRKRFYKKLMATVLVLAILTLILFVVKVYLDGDILKNSDNSQESGFPLTIKDEQLVDIYSVNKFITTLSKSSVAFYDQTGKQKYKFVHGYTNPIFDASNKRTIVYDAGSNKIRVDTTKGTVGEIETEDTILFAKMSDGDNFAVVTRSERYASILTVYDKNLKAVFEWSSANEQVISLCFSPNGKSFYAATLVPFNGIIGTNIYKLNINEEKEIFKTEIKDLLPLSMDYKKDDNISIIGKSKTVTIDYNGNLKDTYLYNKKLLGFDNSADSGAVIALEDAFDHQTHIITIDNYGKVNKSIKIDDQFKDVNISSTRIIVLCKNHLYNYDLSLNHLNTIELQFVATRAKVIDNGAYTMGVGFINKNIID